MLLIIDTVLWAMGRACPKSQDLASILQGRYKILKISSVLLDVSPPVFSYSSPFVLSLFGAGIVCFIVFLRVTIHSLSRRVWTLFEYIGSLTSSSLCEYWTRPSLFHFREATIPFFTRLIHLHQPRYYQHDSNYLSTTRHLPCRRRFRCSYTA
jgi:hypothetical protein